jgi:uncharacterized protein (DUF2141 family)
MGRLLVFFFALTLLASSCAIQVPPSGGTKDTIPPVVRKFDPENFSTGFHGHDISISFDEYVELKDLPSQLIVSPPLKYNPLANLKKKTLEIHLEDTLQPNTTYTMNFGNAITDLREGNALENFQYVFSTGDVIDSLKMSGRVQNAFDNKTEKGIYVMLYRNMEDSTPLKNLPDYFSKTNEDGTFVIKNISPGDYKVFALKDNNTNYLFDNNEENIAFSDAMTSAGSSGNLLRLFREKRSQQLLKVSNEEPGHVTISYAQPLENEKLVFLSDTSALKIHSITYSAKRDTISLWYANAQADSLILLIQQDTVTDTIAPRLRHLESYVRGRGTVSLQTQYESGSSYTLNLNRPLQVIFNHPIENFDFSKTVVTEDSLPLKEVTFHFTDSLNRFLEINFKRKEETKYKVEIPKGSFKDIIGLQNDSMEIFFATRSTSDYGTMEIKMNIPEAKNYIVQLIDDKEVIYRQTVFHSDTSIYYDYLDPKTYRLKLIEDSNANGEWDTGNYLKHLQPENIFYYKEDMTVRANWDVDVKWNVAP